MKKIIVATLLLSAALFGMSDKELATAINLAGKQRMLTQKMSKESLLVFIGIDLDKNIQKLKKTSALFDKTLNGLLNGDSSLNLVASKNKEIENKLKEVAKLWQPFKERIDSVASLKNLNDETFNYIEENNIPLLKKMNEAVTLYTKLGNNGTNKLKMANDINLAGKQRMLTQKIAKDILLIQANINSAKAQQDLQNSVKLFDKTLKGLYNGDSSLKLLGTKLPKIVKQLDITKKSWQEAKPLIEKAIKDKENQNLTKDVIAKLDETKVNMNSAVELYAKSLNRQKQVMKLNALINGFMNKKDNSKHLINLAGKQRMLTQRVAKLALECSLVKNLDSCSKLDKFANLYNKTLKGFENGDSDLKLDAVKSKVALEQISKIKNLWQPFYKAVKSLKESSGSNLDALKFIDSKNLELLKESNNLVSILEKESSKSVSYIEKAQLKIVNIAGRERMLTQKMTKELLEYLKLNSATAKESINKTKALFSNSLEALINGSNKLKLPKVTNSEIKKQLLKVQTMWQKIEPFYNKDKLSKREFTLLLKVNPILLKEMNNAVTKIENSTDY